MIGIFDSGSGGLSVLKAIKKVSPSADIIYFGDIVNIPYGGRSRREINELTTEGIRLLLDEGATQIVNACNSMSSSLLLSTIEILGLNSNNLIEMVGPTVSQLKEKKRKKIAVVATEATVKAKSYLDGFSLIGVTIEQYACPGLVDAIEEGAAEDEVRPLVDDVLKKVVEDRCEIIILGCTHYPLIRGVFEDSAKLISSREVEFFDPAAAVAMKVAEKFDTSGSGSARFIVSADSRFFRSEVDAIMEQGYDYEIKP